MGRVLLLLDGPNLFHGGLDQFPEQRVVRVNFRRLRERAEKFGSVVEALAFVVTAPNDRSEGIIRAIQRCGFRVTHKEVRVYRDRVKNSSCEVEIAVEAASRVDDFDRLVLVSGSRNYVPLLEKLRAKGKRITVMMFQEPLSADLARLANDIVFLSEDDLMQR